MPPEVAKDTLVLPYNDVAALEAAFDAHARELACVMIEPIAGNMNFVRASVPFMTRSARAVHAGGALLVFDEVMTGFRVALGSAQSDVRQSDPRLRARPVSVFGKVIGGGMPLAAFGGKRDVMSQLAPLGPVYQAGTLSGNPVATACGLATLREIAKPGFFDALSQRTRTLVDGLVAARRGRGCAMVLQRQRRRHVRLLLCRQRCRRTMHDCDGDRQGTLQPLLPRHAGPAACTWPRRFTKLDLSARRTAADDIDSTVGGRRPGLRA